jgi:hypothetical protein
LNRSGLDGGFDGRRGLRIHRGLAFLEPLATPIRIPWLPIGTQAIGVGPDRLAWTARLSLARRILRLDAGWLGRIHRGQKARIATAATSTLGAWSAVKPRTIAARGSPTAFGTAITATAGAGAESTALAAGTVRTTPIATRATGSTGPTTRTSTSAASALAHVTRSRGQLPADTGARRLPTSRTIVAVVFCILRGADLEAAEATRFVASAAKATRATGTAAAAAAATTTATTTAATFSAIVTPAWLRGSHAVDRVVKLAARHRAVRSGLALKHTDESDALDVADDVERFE